MSYVKKKIRDFADRIDEILNENVWYVTELVQCPYKHYLRVRYPYLDLSTVFNERVMLGIVIHKGIQNILIESLDGEKVEIEKPISKSFNIDGREIVLKGRVDLLVNDEVVYEIKTMNKFNGSIPDHYIKQLQIYLNLLGVETGKLVIVNLDGSVTRKFYIYEYKREELNIEEILRKCVNLEVEPMEWECKYCQYLNVCERKKNEC